MGAVFINPGSGHVRDYGLVRESWAESNMRHFVAELSQSAGRPVHCERRPKWDESGRFGFRLRLGKRGATVLMPGCALKRVRFVSGDGQNPWHFPRLYVNWNSWLWEFAVSDALEELVGEK